MVSRSLLLVLLVLACLQFFTLANNANGPDQCCFKYQQKPIPAHRITAYKKTRIDCTLPGVLFTLKNGKKTCAHPEDEWVKNIMKQIDQSEFKNLP